MEIFIGILITATFVCFLMYRCKVTEKVNKAIDAVMKKWTKNTDGG